MRTIQRDGAQHLVGPGGVLHEQDRDLPAVHDDALDPRGVAAPSQFVLEINGGLYFV